MSGRFARLADDGVVAVALSFTDTSGINRVKAVPLAALAAAADQGVGASPSFDIFLSDDTMASGSTISGPDGDLRLIPDLGAIRTIPGQPGWAWAPVDRYFQNGTPYPACHRLFLADMIKRADAQQLAIQTGIELEFRLFAETPTGYEPASSAPAYSMGQLLDVGDFATDLLESLDGAGLRVAQFHPEAAHGQFEVSLAPSDPMTTADTNVLLRHGIRSVAARHSLAASFSPVPVLDEAGNGGHVHLSLSSRETGNVFAGGTGPYGMQEAGQQFIAGILENLVPLTAVLNPAPVSYLRLRPSRWADAFATWGLEAREAAVRFISAPSAEYGAHANIEIKSPDLAASPYLAIGCLIAAGLDGVARKAGLASPVQGDPGTFSAEELRNRDIRRLPQNLDAATDAFRLSHLLAGALGATLFDAIVAVRRGEQVRCRRLDPAEIVDQSRWIY